MLSATKKRTKGLWQKTSELEGIKKPCTNM